MSNFRLILFILLSFALISNKIYSQYLSGYATQIIGESLKYESQQPDANESLLVRSMDKSKYIEWNTAVIPEDYSRKYAEFILLAGIDVNAENNHEFKMYINDELQFTFSNPIDTLNKDWEWESESGIIWHNKGVMIDKYQDLFSYIFLKIPRSVYVAGEAVKIKVEGETANSRSWFMVFKYSATQAVKFIPEEAILKEGNKEKQLVRVDILHFDDPAIANLKIGGIKASFPVDLGFNMFRMTVPKVNKITSLQANVRINDKEVISENIEIKPVEDKTIYLLPHSHVDIGYTHVQEEVEKIQWQNIRDAISYSNKTKDYPPGAQFKWNGEVMWALDSYYQQCTDQEKSEFVEAVQKGWFEPDGLYANILTGLCRPEELYRMMESAMEIGSHCKTDIKSAMITDIPGYTWAMVPVLAQSGIKYFSIGTNTFHRIGNIIDVWGDKPFYWESPSGEEKILCWIHGKGYSEFHTGLAYTKLRNKLKEQLIFDYIRELGNNEYPYDIITMRYNIGSDNGPPDPFLSDIVKNWNETYSSPKLVISTVGESFSIFEEKYGNDLPAVRGDLTGYWEDGAGSSSLETAKNRASAERLTQAATLFSIYNPDNYPQSRFEEAWKKILLYSEHTWGSWNSISEPFSEFTLQQWETKKSFADDASEASKQLLVEALPFSMAETVTEVEVFNSNSWERTDLVKIPSNSFLKGERVKDESGQIISSQRLSTGELVFIVENIPAFGSRKYFFDSYKNKARKGDETDEALPIFNHINMDINEETGAISMAEFRDIPFNIVNNTFYSGLNQYYYTEGRNPENSKTAQVSSIVVKEAGDVLKTIQITLNAPGCDQLISEITYYKKLDRIDLTNILDKKDILEQEGVHFVFPFNIPEGKTRISNAWGFYEADEEQLPASNKNFFTANRWADISNDKNGVTFIPIDAPLIELNEITCDPIDYGWIDTLQKTQTIISYVMNNYWETNYKASQSGEITFRYSLFPHFEFDPAQCEKWGIEQHQPLIPVVSDRFTRHASVPFVIDNQNVIIESVQALEPDVKLLRVYNPGFKDEIVNFQWFGSEKKIYLCDPFGNNTEPTEREIEVSSRGVINLIIQD